MKNEIREPETAEKAQANTRDYELEIRDLISRNEELIELLDKRNKEKKEMVDLLQHIKDEKCEIVANLEKEIAFLKGQIDAYQYALNTRRI